MASMVSRYRRCLHQLRAVRVKRGLYIGILVLTWVSPFFAQTNAGDYAITYGVNYSSGDRKSTIFPSWVGPASFVYRPWCRVALGIDDDTFVSNNSATGWNNGTGDLGFEGHLTIWNAHNQAVNSGDCAAKSNAAITVDYLATVPVSGTLESTELVHQTKGTYNRPLTNGNFFANAGIVVTGLSSGGTTQNALVTANYLRNLNKDGSWGAEGEVDLQSSSKVGPSSASVLFAFDRALGKNQNWGIRFGTSVGVTPYAPKVSPFFQLSYNGSFKPKKKLTPSVLRE